jgi:hypothetical protein
MKKVFILLFILPFLGFAQSTLITPGNGQPNILANSTNNGIVSSKMTYSQIVAIQNPTVGTLIYDTDFKTYRFWNGSKWVSMAMPCMEGCEVCEIPGTITGWNLGGSVGSTYNPKRVMSINNQNEMFMVGGGVSKFSNNGILISTIVSAIANFSHLVVKNDASNNLYVAGFYFTPSSSPTYAGMPLQPAPSGNRIVFVAKFNSAGVIQWVKNGYQQDINTNRDLDLEIDGSENVYLSGNFTTSTTFGNTTLNSFGGQDIYLVIDVVLDNSLSFRTFSVILTYKIWNGVQEINRLPA